MNSLLKNWDAARIVRLVAGLGFGIYALVWSEYIFLILAALFLLQAAFNVSCCGAGGCSSGNDTKQQEVYKGQIKKYKG